MGCQVQLVNDPMDVIHVARGQNGEAGFHPISDHCFLGWTEYGVTLRLEVTPVGVHHGYLIHLDPPFAVFRIDPKDRCAIVADAKIELWQICHVSPLQKSMMRWQASLSASSEVA